MKAPVGRGFFLDLRLSPQIRLKGRAHPLSIKSRQFLRDQSPSLQAFQVAGHDQFPYH